MYIRELVGKRYKEQPAEAYMASHTFLLRGGYIRQVAGGIFTLLTPAKRIAAKIEQIFREEIDAVGGQEVMFPVVLPGDLWRESGRFDGVGSELMRMQDRTGRDLVLGMTHEEAAVHLARSEVLSYSEYPFSIYQIQTKFRDEPRSRAGLIRVREFTMKDAYSFHTSQECLEKTYDDYYHAYERIYQRAGLNKNVIAVKSDNGMMGGKTAHEFMYLSDDGEDTLVLCPHCGYRSNVEVASCGIEGYAAERKERQEHHTPDITDIDSLANFFHAENNRLIKATVFAQSGSTKPLVVFIRGDYQVNESKLRALVGRQVFPYVGQGEDCGLCFGFIGPVGLAGDFDILYDRSIAGMEDAICGANKEDYHCSGVSVERDLPGIQFVDVNKARSGDACSSCGKPIEVKNGIEIGNIFQLGDRYTRSMNMTYIDQDGSAKHPIMGCYGIGVGRLLSCVIEEHHDDNGPIWPIALAPWHIHICILGNCSEENRAFGENLYRSLSQRHEVLCDDRNATAGVQFADADLLGAPVRVIISERNMKNGEVEIALRDKSMVKKVPKEQAEQEVEAMVNALWEAAK